MRKIMAVLLTLALIGATPAYAGRGGGGGGGGGRSSGGGGGGSKSSGSSKSSGGSKSSNSSKSSSSKSSGSSKQPTASKPSSGPIPQRAPVTKLIPPAPPAPKIGVKGTAVPPRVSVPPGRTYQADRDFIVRNPRYADPYGVSYYGSYDSPFFYLWLFSITDNDRSNDPRPPEAQGQVSDALTSYLGIIKQQADFMVTKAAK